MIKMMKTGHVLKLLMAVGLAACLGRAPLSLTGPTAAEERITASGFIEATVVNIASEVGGRVLAVEAAEGQAVTAGQVVVRLDQALTLSQQRQAEAALASAQAVLAQTQAGPRPDLLAAAEADLARAQAELEGARQAVVDARAILARPPGLAAQITQAETQVRLAEQGVEQARAALSEAELWRNVSKEGTTEREIQDHRLAAARADLAAAEAQVSGAKAYLAKLQAVRRFPAELVAEVHAAESRAEIAGAQVDAAAAALRAVAAGAAAEEIAVAEADVRSAEAALSLIEAQLARFTLASPIDGVVTQKLVQAGEVARAGLPLLAVSDLGRLTLVVYVPETRIGQVSIGQQVEVGVDAYPGRTFAGSVISIGREAEFTPSNVQTAEERVKLVFAVKIRIPNPGGELKPGMPADATFGGP